MVPYIVTALPDVKLVAMKLLLVAAGPIPTGANDVFPGLLVRATVKVLVGNVVIPVQYIAPTETFPVPEFDATGSPPIDAIPDAVVNVGVNVKVKFALTILPILV
jgi:hypothetical protein